MLLSKMLFLLFFLKQLMFVTDVLNSLCCLLDIGEEIATWRSLLQDECQRSRYYSTALSANMMTCSDSPVRRRIPCVYLVDIAYYS
jgi:hypothetical protein